MAGISKLKENKYAFARNIGVFGYHILQKYSPITINNRLCIINTPSKVKLSQFCIRCRSRMASSKIACVLCAHFAGNTFADVVRHIGYVHAWEPNFQITCGLDECKRQYRSFMAYRNHLYKAHGGLMNASMATELFQPPVELRECNTTVDELDLASLGMFDECSTIGI